MIAAKAKFWWLAAFVLWGLIAWSSYERRERCAAGGGCITVTADDLKHGIEHDIAEAMQGMDCRAKPARLEGPPTDETRKLIRSREVVL